MRRWLNVALIDTLEESCKAQHATVSPPNERYGYSSTGCDFALQPRHWHLAKAVCSGGAEHPFPLESQ